MLQLVTGFVGLCERQFPVNHQEQGQLLIGELWWGLEDLASNFPVEVNASITCLL